MTKYFAIRTRNDGMVLDVEVFDTKEDAIDHAIRELPDIYDIQEELWDNGLVELDEFTVTIFQKDY